MLRVIAVFVAAAVLLTGCVGIPTSGGVETGPIIGSQLPPNVAYVPSGPTPGSDQQELLEDFMLALRGPQNNYAIAKQFLTKDLAPQWNPEESATVRTGIPSTTAGADTNTLLYTVTTRAVVDADGRYSEQDPVLQTFTYAFVKEDGEWRISSAPNGVVLSQASFNTVFAERALYFFDPSFAYLVPDVRWFPSRTTLPVRIVGALTAGPVAWLQQGAVLSAFPIATGVDSVDIESGTATVELTQEALVASPTDRDRMRQQLAATLDVATVVMRVGGLVLQTPAVGIAAVKNPQVEGAVLAGTGDNFGFETVDGVTAIDGISDKVVAAGATAATLSSDKASVAILAADGVSLVRTSGDSAELLDGRPGLVAPAIDPFRFVWSAQWTSAASITTFGVDGAEHPVQSSLPADAEVVSIAVSRDGTRLLAYLSTTVGPMLYVVGIIRQQGSNIPTSLGEPLELPVVSSTPVDATWVDDRSVATLSRTSDSTPVALVTLIALGGPSAALGQLADATAITGGNNATDGLRVRRANGDIWRAQGGGWVSTGLTASFIGVKQ